MSHVCRIMCLLCTMTIKVFYFERVEENVAGNNSLLIMMEETFFLVIYSNSKQDIHQYKHWHVLHPKQSQMQRYVPELKCPIM